MFKLNHKLIFNLILILTLPTIAQAEQYCSGDLERSNSLAQFQNNEDGTVTDRKTGLMWQRCAEGQTGSDCSGDGEFLTWSNAFARAAAVNSAAYAGYSNWRLPNVKELSSIAERSCRSPAIDLLAFPNTGTSKGFWSSTPLIGNPQSIIQFHYGSGSNSPYFKTSTLQLRLVRDPLAGN